MALFLDLALAAVAGLFMVVLLFIIAFIISAVWVGAQSDPPEGDDDDGRGA